MLLIDFYSQEYRPRRRNSQNTARLFGHAIRKLEAYLGRPAELDDLTDSHVGGCMTWILYDRQLSVRTANEFRDRMLALWRLAARMGKAAEWPLVDAEPQPVRVPKAYSDGNLAALLVAARDVSPVWEALIATCCETGERIGALVDARTAWLVGDALIIPAEYRKGRRMPRRCLLRPACLKLIQTSRNKTHLFPLPIKKQSLYYHLRKITTAAGLEYEKHYSGFHKLRRSYASAIERNGGDATRALGHSSRRVTELYLDPDICGGMDYRDMLPQV